MIKIDAIKIDVNTSSGLYGAFYEFQDGLNIIRGNNTSGKSSLFQTIVYCLGFEELLGGRNEKTMQSVLKESVEYPKDSFHSVLQSNAFIQISNKNGETITVKRGIKNEGRSPKLVDVIKGSYLTTPDKPMESQPMFIHDKGGASDDLYGFHMFLSTFIGWDLPSVLTKSGENRKLYVQQVAPSFILEQKSGWSGFLATMPHYGLASKEARVIEFLLSLDVIENKRKKQGLNIKKRRVEEEWKLKFKHLHSLVDRAAAKFTGIDMKPQVINSPSEIQVYVESDDKTITIADYVSELLGEYEVLEAKSIGQVSELIDGHEDKLDQLNDDINLLSFNYETIVSELSLDKNKLNRYNEQLSLLQDDLRKNTGALKVKKLGAEESIEVATDSCPTCHQAVSDSLLPPSIDVTPMNLEDNIKFVKAQIKMIEAYSDGQKDKIRNKEEQASSIKEQLSTLRSEVRGIKSELISDDRLPSEQEIARKLSLKNKIDFYSSFIEKTDSICSEFIDLSKVWEELLGEDNELPQDYFSSHDREKLKHLKDSFIQLLSKFEYSSKNTNDVGISMENYLPVVIKQFDSRREEHDIRFDSSASDFIRCIWAYTCSLYKVASSYSTNHPTLLMMDEPKQQDISIDNFRTFLSELSNYSDGQVLLFASFENSDESYNVATKDISHRLLHIEEKLIKPIL